MKTKTYGSYVYIVKKYVRDENGKLNVDTSTWQFAENAFYDAKIHKNVYGENMALVFKAKHCMKIK